MKGGVRQEDRLHQHTNAEVRQLLDNRNLIRPLNGRKPFELI